MRRIVVTVKPRTGAERVEEKATGELVVCVRAAPEKGRANEAVRRALARHLGVPADALRIVSGKSSRKKVIEVTGEGVVD